MISTKPDRERNNSREKKSRTKIEDTEQPSIADKDYIVFKFNGKGGIDLVEEKSPPRNQDPAGKNRNQKVQFISRFFFFFVSIFVKFFSFV